MVESLVGKGAPRRGILKNNLASAKIRPGTEGEKGVDGLGRVRQEEDNVAGDDQQGGRCLKHRQSQCYSCETVYQSATNTEGWKHLRRKFLVAHYGRLAQMDDVYPSPSVTKLRARAVQRLERVSCARVRLQRARAVVPLSIVCDCYVCS